MTPANKDDNLECPAILVSMAREIDKRLYTWISVGAEEEGIPCRRMSTEETDDTDVATLAYTAARISRLGVGIGIVASRVAIHERHMPAAQPVLASGLVEGHTEHICRSTGSNAARLVVSVPLRLDEYEDC